MSGLRVGVDGGCLWIWGSRYEICVAHACQDEKSSYALIASYKYLTSMNALTKKQVDAANKRRRRAIKYLLEEIRPIPFTEEEIQAAISNLKENGCEVDYYSIFNKIKLPHEPERAPLPPLSVKERKRRQRQREQQEIDTERPQQTTTAASSSSEKEGGKDVSVPERTEPPSRTKVKSEKGTLANISIFHAS